MFVEVTGVEKNPIYVNTENVSMFSMVGGVTRIWFCDGESDYIDVLDSLESIVDLIPELVRRN